MLAAADPVIGAGGIGPSFWGAALRLVLAVGLLALGTWGWLWWQRRARRTSRHLEVLDRALLSRSASVALIRVGEKRLLVGVAADGVRLIDDLGVDGAGDDGSRFVDLLAESSASAESKR